MLIINMCVFKSKFRSKKNILIRSVDSPQFIQGRLFVHPGEAHENSRVLATTKDTRAQASPLVNG